MRKQVMVVTCERCGREFMADDDDAVLGQVTVSYSGPEDIKKSATFADLCPKCDKTVYNAVSRIVNRSGKVDPPKKSEQSEKT